MANLKVLDGDAAAKYLRSDDAGSDGDPHEVYHRNAVSEQGTATVYNVTLTNADTEYSQALPADTRAFEFQCRTAYDVRYAWVTGKVATPTAPYQTLKAGSVKYKENVNLATATLYLASAQAGVVIELEVWT